MKKRIELPLIEPLYQTYHNQAPGTAIAVKNPTIRNWYLNQAVSLTCNRKFLKGFTSPEIMIVDSGWSVNPYLEKNWFSMQFVNGHINFIIREMIDNGYYVAFVGVDDYYVEGKSWYKERHFDHDGIICGYDQNDKTYCIYAYDSNWIYRKFWTSQDAFNRGRIATAKKGVIGKICGLAVVETEVKFSLSTVYEKLSEYLDSDIKKYPLYGGGNVFGIVVHEYIAEYVSKLYSGEIPYERMDRRVFRLLWEHKKAMHERIVLIEQNIGISSGMSKRYRDLVVLADTMRMLYASHHMKRRDSVLPAIRTMLIQLQTEEREILTELLEKMREELVNEALEVSEK